MSPYLSPITDDDLRRYRDLGVDQVILPFLATRTDMLEKGADTVAARVRVAEET